MVRLNHIIFERTRVVIVVPYSSHIGLDISIIRSPKNQMIKEGKSTVDNQPRYKLSLWSWKRENQNHLSCHSKVHSRTFCRKRSIFYSATISLKSSPHPISPVLPLSLGFKEIFWLVLKSMFFCSFQPPFPKILDHMYVSSEYFFMYCQVNA